MIDYISDATLWLLQSKCENLVCNECGRHHRVEFKTDTARHALFWDFPENDTCEGFKEQVSNLVNSEASRDNRDLLSQYFGLDK